MDENHYQALPVALYGVVPLKASVAYGVLSRILIRANGRDCPLAHAYRRARRPHLDGVVASGIGMRLVATYLAVGLDALLAALWRIADRRIESQQHA